MRSILIALVLGHLVVAAPVFADPPASVAAIITPPANPERWQAYTPPATAAASVIDPPATQDARPAPRGMVIAPPATRDTMGCAPPLFWEPRALWQHVERGATRLGSLLRAYGF